ncbi:uncharacterized [Tachysurus ichikawai]
MKSQAQVWRIKGLVPEERSCHDDTRSNLLPAAMESSIVISPPDSCLKDANYYFFSQRQCCNKLLIKVCRGMISHHAPQQQHVHTSAPTN